MLSLRKNKCDDALLNSPTFIEAVQKLDRFEWRNDKVFNDSKCRQAADCAA